MADIIIDKDFGFLQYVESLEGNAFWAGKLLFRKTNIDIFFEASEKNPSTEQRVFFKSIEKGYEALVSSIYTVLPKSLKADKLLINKEYFLKQFSPKAIMILRISDNITQKWSMTWQSQVNTMHFLSVDFDGFKPLRALLEK